MNKPAYAAIQVGAQASGPKLPEAVARRQWIPPCACSAGAVHLVLAS